MSENVVPGRVRTAHAGCCPALSWTTRGRRGDPRAASVSNWPPGSQPPHLTATSIWWSAYAASRDSAAPADRPASPVPLTRRTGGLPGRNQLWRCGARRISSMTRPDVMVRTAEGPRLIARAVGVMSLAFLFPGQGVPASEHAPRLADKPARSARLSANHSVGSMTSTRAAALASTVNVQMALLIAGVACARALTVEHDLTPAVRRWPFGGCLRRRCNRGRAHAYRSPYCGRAARSTDGTSLRAG